MFGEVMNMLTCYNFFVFTDYVPNYETRFQWAFTSIMYVTFMIFVNMIVIGHDYLNSMIRCG